MSEENAVIDTDNGIPNEIAEQSQPEWFWSSSEGSEVKGAGDRPEFLLPKYKSVEDQARSYPELQKKMGSYTGAPEEYSNEFLGDGFEPGESFDSAQELFRELGTSQEGYEKLMAFHHQEMEALANHYNNPAAEREALGANSDLRIGNVDRFLKANLSDDEYAEMSQYVTSAGSIKLVERLAQLTAPKKLPSQGGDNPTGATSESLEKMRYAKDENGNFKMSVDSAYKAHVEAEWAKYYGNGPASEVVSF